MISIIGSTEKTIKIQKVSKINYRKEIMDRYNIPINPFRIKKYNKKFTVYELFLY